MFMEAVKGTSSPSPSLPLLTRFVIKVINTVTDAARRKNGTVNRRLLSFLNYVTPPNPIPVKGVSTIDVTVDPNRNLWFRLFIPTVDLQNPLPVIVFFHGGGFAFLSPDNKSYDAVCRRFARKTPAVVVSVNYRLSPEYRYPAQYEDGYDALQFLDDENNKGILPDNADVSRCFLAGDSAGANLAHHVALRAGESQFKKLKARPHIIIYYYYYYLFVCFLKIDNSDNWFFSFDFALKNIKVMGVIAIQPFFGGEERTKAEIELAGIDPLVSTERTDWLWKAYLGEGEGTNRDHEAINVSGLRALDIKQKEFPASLIVVGGFDSLKDWQKRYYEYLKNSGKEVQLLEYPNMIHAFYIFPELTESAHLISQVKQFIHKSSKL